jgi:hypothetical protein
MTTPGREPAITEEQLRRFADAYGRWHDAVAVTSCPVCEAGPGQDCPPNEFGRPDIHAARWDAYAGNREGQS